MSVDTTKFSDRQRRVVAGIQHAFSSYEKYAWGHDEHMVLNKGFTNWGDEGTKKIPHGLALTLIEALGTLWIAGLTDEFQRSVLYLASMDHSFDRNVDVSLFETTIRILGGLLSAYELSGELILLDKAYDIGGRLFHAVTARAIPHALVNLHTGRGYSPQWLGSLQSLAEVTSIQLEFCKLSQLTGDMDFCEGVTRIMRTILRHTPASGLFPIYVRVADGTPASEKPVTLGARGDSFYEYLAKQWVLTNKTEKWLQEAYEKTSNGIIEKLLKQMDENHAFIAEARDTGGNSLEYKMDHLVCFVVGMLQIAKHGKNAARDDKAAGDIARTCHSIYTSNPTGLGVEIVRFSEHGGKYEMFPSQGAYHYIMRPEVIEAMFYQTRYHPEEYETWSNMAWVMYEAMEKHLWVEDGWTGLQDATRLGSSRTEKMESFFVAETLKYAFLAAADKEVAPTQLPLTEWVFNTEAHPLRIISGALQ